MKTTWRKLLVLMLSLTMVLAYTVPSFAMTGEEEDTMTSSPEEEPLNEETDEKAAAGEDEDVDYAVSCDTSSDTIFAGQTLEEPVTISRLVGNEWQEIGLREGDTIEYFFDMGDVPAGIFLEQRGADGFVIDVAEDVELGDDLYSQTSGLEISVAANIRNADGETISTAYLGTVGYLRAFELRACLLMDGQQVTSLRAQNGAEIILTPVVYQRSLKDGALVEEPYEGTVTWTPGDGTELTDNGDGTWTHIKNGSWYDIDMYGSVAYGDNSSLTVWAERLTLMSPVNVYVQTENSTTAWTDDTDYQVYADTAGQDVDYNEVRWIVTWEPAEGTAVQVPADCLTGTTAGTVENLSVDVSRINEWHALANGDRLEIEIQLLKNGYLVAGNLADQSYQNPFRLTVQVAYEDMYPKEIKALTGETIDIGSVYGYVYSSQDYGSSVQYKATDIQTADETIATFTQNSSGS